MYSRVSEWPVGPVVPFNSFTSARPHPLKKTSVDRSIGNFEENNMYSKQLMRTCARVCNYGITTFTKGKNRKRLFFKSHKICGKNNFTTHLISLRFIFGEMWSGNEEGGADHMK